MSEPRKTCLDCQRFLPLADFYKAPKRKDGRGSYCRPCHKARRQKWYAENKAAHQEMVRRWCEAHPEETRAIRFGVARRQRLKQYGLTVEEYTALAEAQGGLCAICRGPQRAGRYLAVDHCHETGQVRGLLCDGCNTAIGRLGDTADALYRAWKYLAGAR